MSLALPLAACLGTSTGNPAEPGGESTGNGGLGGYCKEVSSRPVQLDEQTGLGFSAREVLANVEGEHIETLTWHPQPLASYGPESGEHQLTLTITRRDEPLRLTHYTPDGGNGEEIANIGIGADCSDALEIDVQVTVRSDGGALDESFDTTLVVRSRNKVSLYQRLDPEQLGGSFAVTEFHQPRYRIAQLSLSATFSRYGTSGALNVVFEQPSADGTAVGSGPGNGPLASWGPPSCGPWGGDAVPLDAEVAAFSGNEALALLDTFEQVNVAWSGAAASSASFDFALSGGVCAQLEPTPFSPNNNDVGTLTFVGTLDVHSQDGRIDAAWPVQVTAAPAVGGGLGELRLVFDDQRLAQQGSLQTRYGVSGIDGSSYDFFGAGLQLTLTPDGALSGELRVIGYDLPMCSSEPIVDAQGRVVGSSGCMGATPNQLGVALFSPAT